MSTDVSVARVTALYRFYNAAGDLLYVGVTFTPGIRFDTHSDKKHWWTEVRRIELAWYDTRVEAEAAEVAAIESERPLWNIRDSQWRAVLNEEGAHVLAPKPPRKPGRGTDRQSFRYGPEKWQRFVELAEPNGSAVLQQFMDWQIGEPGARRPQRPTHSRV